LRPRLTAVFFARGPKAAEDFARFLITDRATNERIAKAANIRSD
jgi:hypothetical protein